MKAKEKSDLEALRRTAAFIDFSWRGRIRARGKQRIEFLHKLLSVDVKNLKPEESQTGCLLSSAGKILALLDVTLDPASESVWLDTHESDAASVIALLEKYHFSEQVTWEDVSDAYGEIALEGPESEAYISGFKEKGILCFRKGILAPNSGWKLWAAPELVNEIEHMPIPRASMSAYETLRIEAGEPDFGVDIDEHTLAAECGHEEWLSTTKGCYPGQEIVARVRHLGKPPRLLVRLKIQSDSPDCVGANILKEEKVIGTITSAAPSLEPGVVWALGRVPYEEAAEGNPVQIQSSERTEPAVIQLIKT
ncbi:MAG: hypothetical protein HY586_05515 [Candidatus Omnitrophica bacterium]|nr:hypothetical protein [Candidatus Omnitrophota bacterium]